jgi:integrase
MPKKRDNITMVSHHFSWIIYQRDGVFYADGRNNAKPLGRYSLGVKTKGEIPERLYQLDKVLYSSRTNPISLKTKEPLNVEEGIRLYMEHQARPRSLGGVKTSSFKRYRAVLDKFILFCKTDAKINNWDQMNTLVFEKYASWLDKNGYAHRTQYLEIVCLKQVFNWIVENDLILNPAKISIKLSKAKGSDTYCWRPEEVQSMVALCDSNPKLQWLGGIIGALASTGLRISELASLRWDDIDFESQRIQIKDESSLAGTKKPKKELRTTKSSRSRSFPIHNNLQPILKRLKELKSRDELVFHGPLGGKLKPDTIRNILKREVLSPLTGRFPASGGAKGFNDGRLHSFRHFFCSACANNRVPEALVMNWLGHQDSEMVRYYYHIHDDVSRQFMSEVKLY